MVAVIAPIALVYWALYALVVRVVSLRVSAIRSAGIWQHIADVFLSSKPTQ